MRSFVSVPTPLPFTDFFSEKDLPHRNSVLPGLQETSTVRSVGSRTYLSSWGVCGNVRGSSGH